MNLRPPSGSFEYRRGAGLKWVSWVDGETLKGEMLISMFAWVPWRNVFPSVGFLSASQARKKGRQGRDAPRSRVSVDEVSTVLSPLQLDPLLGVNQETIYNCKLSC